MSGRLEEYRGARIVMAGSTYLNMVTTSNSKFAEFRNRRKFLMEFAIHFQCTTRTESASSVTTTHTPLREGNLGAINTAFDESSRNPTVKLSRN